MDVFCHNKYLIISAFESSLRYVAVNHGFIFLLHAGRSGSDTHVTCNLIAFLPSRCSAGLDRPPLRHSLLLIAINYRA